MPGKPDPLYMRARAALRGAGADRVICDVSGKNAEHRVGHTDSGQALTKRAGFR